MAQHIANQVKRDALQPGPVSQHPNRFNCKHQSAAIAIGFPKEMFTVMLPTLVMWGLGGTALLPGLIDGLDEFVPAMQLEKVVGDTLDRASAAGVACSSIADVASLVKVREK